MFGQAVPFNRHPSYRYFSLPRPVTLNGSWTSLFSIFGPHFYHWIYEELPRLWALPEFPPDTGILIPPHTPPYVLDTLQWLGLWDRVRPTPERHLLVEQYYFSAPTAMMGCPNPHAIAWLRERLMPFSADSTGPKKIYLVRHEKTRGLTNERDVAEIFADRGWTSVDPGKLRLAEQMALFAGAEMIAGLHGGAFTNLLWCRPGTRVLELFAESFVNGCYEGIASCLRLEHRYFIFPADGFDRATVDLLRLRQTLDEWD
jgi:capsular polysaccharide biosynthesis protein